MTTLHGISPVFDHNSRVLLLGSFPSVKSREVGFFYGHPQNRFWKTLAAVLGAEIPQTVEEKRRLLLEHGIALWDVVAECEITGSSDSSIHAVIANDVERILQAAPIERIFANGKTAHCLYMRHLYPRIAREAICLPSTSPANAAWGQERLTEAWQCILSPIPSKTQKMNENP